MRAVVIPKHGPADVLRVEERPEPVAGAGEIVVDVRAAGVNFADLMARLGFYPDAPPLPAVMGYEVAGIVTALGEGVTEFAPGERVFAGTRFGGYCERIAVSATDAVHLPEQMSFEQGAAIPVNYATAMAALHRFGNVQPGERVLIHAAAGGVGIAATQLARAAGLEIWGTASPGKHDRIRAFGVEHPVDYRHKGWQKGLPEFDLVLDAIGGRSFRIGYDLLAPGGRLVAFGASAVVSGERRNFVQAARAAVSMPRFNLIKQMSASKAVIGLNMLRLFDAHGAGAWIAPLKDRIADGTVDPVVSDAVPFAQAAEAHRILTERRNVGKVVLVP